MKRLTSVVPAAIGILGGLLLFAGLSDLRGTGQAVSLPVRAYLPQLANDEVHATGLSCGEERWAVKTLSDASAGAVNFAPQSTSVDQLRALAAPKVGDNTPRIGGVEFTTYTLTAKLLKMKQEDDRDIHLVVGDLVSGNTMIVEFP